LICEQLLQATLVDLFTIVRSYRPFRCFGSLPCVNREAIEILWGQLRRGE